MSTLPLSKRQIAAGTLALLLGCALNWTTAAYAATLLNASVPVSTLVLVACPGAEAVAVSGTLHVLSTFTTDNSGAIHVGLHSNGQDLVGTGLATGASYQFTAVQNARLTVGGPFPLVLTATQNLTLAGPGPDNGIAFHATLHITYNADGTATATVENISGGC